MFHVLIENGKRFGVTTKDGVAVKFDDTSPLWVEMLAWNVKEQKIIIPEAPQVGGPTYQADPDKLDFTEDERKLIRDDLRTRGILGATAETRIK